VRGLAFLAKDLTLGVSVEIRVIVVVVDQCRAAIA